MEKQQLNERLILIENELRQTMANFNLLEGCRKELMHWIDKLEENKNESKSIEKRKKVQID